MMSIREAVAVFCWLIFLLVWWQAVYGLLYGTLTLDDLVTVLIGVVLLPISYWVWSDRELN
jgi:hypothetical protein